jgi:hypothetical protein
MRSLLRGATRFTITTLAMSGLTLGAFGLQARAAGVAPKANTPPLVTAGRNSNGDTFVTGPANLIAKFCPNNARTGYVCLFSGFDETGEGVAVLRGNNTPPSECDDLPAGFVVENAENETNRKIQIGDGTCANKGPVVDADIEPGQDENITPTDVWVTG